MVERADTLAKRASWRALYYIGPLDNGDFSQLLQKNCFTGRTLPCSLSTDVAARARLWERRAGAGGRRGGTVPVGEDVPRLLDSSESRARDSEEDLFRESRLELLRGKDRFRDDSRFVSLLPLLLPLPLLLDKLLLPSESRLESRGFDSDLPPLSRLESRGGLVNDLSDSLLSFLPGGRGTVANGDVVLPLVALPGKGMRLGRRRGDGLISTGWWWSRADSVLLPGSRPLCCSHLGCSASGSVGGRC